MKVKYVVEMEEVTTCNRCIFTEWVRDNYGEIEGGPLCMHPHRESPIDVEEYARSMCKKPEDCPLIKLS